MLDTDAVSYLIKGTSPAIETRLSNLDTMQVCISAVTRAGLRLGIRRLPQPFRRAERLEQFFSAIHTLPWDEEAADQFAEVRVELERAGTPIGALDTMIAAHAKAVDAVLVTNNLRHFDLVKGLRVENWSR